MQPEAFHPYGIAPAARGQLYLRFRSGELYCYLDFPPQQYRDFLADDSKGRYFSSNIHDHFRYQHLLTVGGIVPDAI